MNKIEQLRNIINDISKENPNSDAWRFVKWCFDFGYITLENGRMLLDGSRNIDMKVSSLNKKYEQIRTIKKHN